MKDWRKPGDYTYLKNLELRFWAWEFLRRNERYREDFERELEVFSRVRLSTTGFDWLPTDVEHPDFLIPHYDDPGEVSRWGLLAYFNPRQERPTHLQFFPPGYEVGTIHTAHDFREFVETPDLISKPGKCRVPLEGGQVVFIFDLSLPITPQLNQTKRTFRFYQDWFEKRGAIRVRKRRRRTEKWTRYLRVLDGKEAGASLPEMAKILFPKLSDEYKAGHKGRKMVANQLRQARRLVDAYLEMLL